MDKYTVDLDKVLNDFEYSELTDQYNSSKVKCNEPNSADLGGVRGTPHRNDPTSAYKLSSAKHSINNVFQSLNEYLNTDIRSHEQQNYESKKVIVKYPDVPVVNKGSSIINNSETLTENKSKADLKEFIINNDLSNCKTDVDNTTSKNFNVNSSGNVQKVSNIQVSDIAVGRQESQQIEEFSDGNERKVPVSDKLSSKVLEYNTSVENKSSGIEKTENKVLTKITEDLIDVKEIVPSEAESKEDEDKKLNSQITNSKDRAYLKDEDDSQIRKNLKEVTENGQKIGFDAVDVDEAELEEYLRELEDECDESSEEEENDNNIDELKPKNEVVDNTEVSVNSENVGKIIDNEDNHKKNEEEFFDATASVDDSKSDPKEIVECLPYSKDLPESKNEISLSLIKEDSEKCKTSTTKEVTKQLEEKDDKTDLQQNINETKREEESNLQQLQNPETNTTEETTITLKDDKETLIEEQCEIEAPRRPSILEVKSVMEEEPAKISTIGKPGSTPFEYKSFDSNEDAGTESDIDDSSSASPSPTFSDMSTVSSATTATMDSCNNSIEQNLNTKADVNLVTNKNPENYQVQTSETNDDNNFKETPSRGAEDTGEPTDTVLNNAVSNESSGSQPNCQGYGTDSWLGKKAPLWIPDSEALNCLHCDMKFTIIKRRHHCRACGLVLCSKCCNLQYRLEYLDAEARVCNRCYEILTRDDGSSGSEVSPSTGNSPSFHGVQPNPNNPMEYCSMVPPLQQVSGASSQNPPTVMVPVSVLKRKGSGKARKTKSVMFCDGIRPGSELTNLDNDFNYSDSKVASQKILASPPPKVNRNVPEIDNVTKSFIPIGENELPPLVSTFKSDISYKEQANDETLMKIVKEETLTFALQKNLYVNVRVIDKSCCINKMTWCFSTEGLINEGQDEIVILLEYLEDEKVLPKEVFLHLNNICMDAKKGSKKSELDVSLHQTPFLGSKNHAGFLYIRPTHQCLKNVIIPKEPYLVGVLIHRWEIPWAKIFPLRLVLRLGAEYKYYPTPLLSFRHRESVFVELGHTIITLLADFRNFSYTLPNIRGLVIHMEDKTTTVTIPSNRYDEVIKAINNSSEHILSFGGNFSPEADAHLVCMQDTQGKNENNYSTHTISIKDRPIITVTGVNFIVFNGILKSTAGLTAKSSMIEDGIMIQIPPEKMEKLREDLRNMKNHTIYCGQINAPCDETVKIVWGENDVNFNVGVLSPVDNESLSGVPSIRVHNGKDHVCNSGSRMIRWTEVFILQNGDENCKGQDIDYSKISESIAKATCQALLKYLDLLSSNNFYKIGIRTNLHLENVSYSAGSNGIKLPPIYMKSLDNELIPVLHRITSNNWGDATVTLELIFRVLNV